MNGISFCWVRYCAPYFVKQLAEASVGEGAANMEMLLRSTIYYDAGGISVITRWV